jgi:hypothetical protein
MRSRCYPNAGGVFVSLVTLFRACVRQFRSKEELLRWQATQELSIPLGWITAEVHISAVAARPLMRQDPEPYH